ncbi:MAG: hypothetical protein SF029_15240 [bacterium]|nr:hypothetical protein [bacterium]
MMTLGVVDSRDLERRGLMERVLVDRSAVWKMGAEAIQALYPIYRLGFQAMIRSYELEAEWIILFFARSTAPQPLTLPQLQRYLPYTAESRRTHGLNRLVTQGMMAETEDGAYHLTTQGSRAAERILRIAQRELGKAKVLPQADARRLADLLWPVVQAALQTPEPHDKRGLLAYRWMDNGPCAPPVTRIDQYLTDLNRFREDCHYAAWKQHHLPPYVWEALNTVWHGEASTAGELAKKLSFRGYTTEAYAGALELLRECGCLLETRRGTFALTSHGEALCVETEARVEAMFFAPWSMLTSRAWDDVHDLLQRLLVAVR